MKVAGVQAQITSWFSDPGRRISERAPRSKAQLQEHNENSESDGGGDDSGSDYHYDSTRTCPHSFKMQQCVSVKDSSLR